jgi:hypothetical protein
VLFRARDLVHGIVFESIKVLITLRTVLVIIKVLLVVPHDLFGVEGHVAVCVRTLDASKRFECGRHFNFVRAVI